MNIVAIILAIIVILLFYILYKFFLLKSTELSKSASLNATNPDISIDNSPTSTRYAYGIWLYVNSWDSSIRKVIFERNENIKLSFDNTSPVLNCEIYMNDDSYKKLEITDNFPLQKWTYIVVSVDNQYVDTYLDGKLIKSGRMFDTTTTGSGDSQSTSTIAPKDPTEVPMILGGGSQFDAYITKFKHWDEPVDPQTVWSGYMDGNGQGSIKHFISSYGIDLSVLKDNVEQSKYRIL